MTDPFMKQTNSKAPSKGKTKAKDKADRDFSAPGNPAPPKKATKKPAVKQNKVLLELQLNLIDEDPGQPRREDNPGFSAEKLNELVQSITKRGVKTPISVHIHPEKPGRFIINHGARRFRASKIAGKTTIPALLDNDYTRTDQLTENLLREGNTAQEIARAIGEFLKQGMKKKDIAESLGKTAGYVTQYAALLKLPPSIATAFQRNRVTDVTLIYELSQLHRVHPNEIDTWVNDESQEFTRGAMKYLRTYLSQQAQASEWDFDTPGGDPEVENTTEIGNEIASTQGMPSESTDLRSFPHHSDRNNEDPFAEVSRHKTTRQPTETKPLIVKVRHQNRAARLRLDRKPRSGYAWISYDDTSPAFEASLRDLQLIAIEEEPQ
jgi:ParB family transcriptional regulator, chromosome partitioning protein